MRVLLTGADGFGGGWLARRLVAAGWEVTGTRRPGVMQSSVLDPAEVARLHWRELELESAASVAEAARGAWDVVFHLAAVSSGTEARSDPGRAWVVNAAGTARLAEALAAGRPGADPLLVVVSTAEVYGRGDGTPHRETDPLEPCSPYAASKLGAEIAAEEVGRRTGLRVIIVRPFPHTGPGQDVRFVVPALAGRLVAARRLEAPGIKAGNVDVVRDFLDVRDAVAGYQMVAERGVPGSVYNVASGTGLAIAEVARRLMRLLDWNVAIETDARLVRGSDISHLVGDSSRLRQLGWTPSIPFDQTLADLVNAQTH